MDLTPNNGPYNPAPDFVVRYRYERRRGRLQFGSLYRVLGFQSRIVEEKAFGWGLNFSAGFLVSKLDYILKVGLSGAPVPRRAH